MTAEERINRYFNDHFLLQKAYATKAGITQNRFNRIIHGKTKITADEIKRLANSLNLTVDYLLSYGDDQKLESEG